jgi:hypothetical protein
MNFILKGDGWYRDGYSATTTTLEKKEQNNGNRHGEVVE